MLQSLLELVSSCHIIFICFFFLISDVFGVSRRERVGIPVRGFLGHPLVGRLGALSIVAGIAIVLASSLLVLPNPLARVAF